VTGQRALRRDSHCIAPTDLATTGRCPTVGCTHKPTVLQTITAPVPHTVLDQGIRDGPVGKSVALIPRIPLIEQLR